MYEGNISSYKLECYEKKANIDQNLDTKQGARYGVARRKSALPNQRSPYLTKWRHRTAGGCAHVNEAFDFRAFLGKSLRDKLRGMTLEGINRM